MLLLALAVLLSAPVRAAEAPLVFGVFPNLTARETLKTFRPMALALERRLGRPVVLYTARDFPTFAARTREGAYDLVLTAPHMAWMARQEAGYRPLLKNRNPVHGVLLVRADTGPTAVEGLRGGTVAIADVLALATLAVESDLAAQGLERGRDYKQFLSGNHTNALTLLLGRQVDAAIVGSHPFHMLPTSQRNQLRVLARTAPLSSLTYLAHPRLRDREAAALREALLAFADSTEGRAFLDAGGFGGLVDAEDSELAAFRTHALRAQALLRQMQ